MRVFKTFAKFNNPSLNLAASLTPHAERDLKPRESRISPLSPLAGIGVNWTTSQVDF
jgi:hypothetical protein